MSPTCYPGPCDLTTRFTIMVGGFAYSDIDECFSLYRISFHCRLQNIDSSCLLSLSPSKHNACTSFVAKTHWAF